MIADLFHGCLDIQTFHDHSIFPARLSPKQTDYLHSISEVFYERALCTSGVTLEFTTAQPVISFQCAVCAYSRNHNSIDIWEDGENTEVISFSIDHAINEVVYRRRQKGPSTIRIYLPAMASMRLFKLNLGEAVPVARRRKTLLCLGDSITQGIFCQTPSSTYPARLGRTWDLEVINQGIGGFYYDSHFLAPIDADYITVAYGTNDFTHCGDLKIIRSNAAEFFETLKSLYPNARIAVISPTWRADLIKLSDQKRFNEICDMILETAGQYHFQTVSGSSLIDHTPDLFTDSYLHPNDAGFEQYAGRLAGQLGEAWGMG